MEIRVEEKRRKRPLWVWLLPLLLLLALVPLLRRDRGDDRTATQVADTTAAAGSLDTGLTAPGGAGTTSAVGAGANGAIGQFTSFVRQNSAATDEAGQHEYTAGGITRLADALQALLGTAGTTGAAGSTGSAGATGGTATNDAQSMQAALDNMRRQAQLLQSTDKKEDSHSEMARSAFESAAGVMSTLARTRRAAEPTQVSEAARALSTRGALLDQKDKIQAFFDRAATALEGMQAGS